MRSSYLICDKWKLINIVIYFYKTVKIKNKGDNPEVIEDIKKMISSLEQWQQIAPHFLNLKRVLKILNQKENDFKKRKLCHFTSSYHDLLNLIHIFKIKILYF